MQGSAEVGAVRKLIMGTENMFVTPVFHMQGSAEEAAVCKLIMRAEHAVYGNELTEWLLPAEVLASRVRKLCDEVSTSRILIIVRIQLPDSSYGSLNS